MLPNSVLLVGQPTTDSKWTRIAPAKVQALANREVQVHPGELLKILGDDALRVVVLDVRPESEFNLFHLHGSQNVQPDQLAVLIPELHTKQALNTIFVTVSNDEAAATEAWKVLTAESIPNAYILEGGINNWIATFGQEEVAIRPTPTPTLSGNDTLQFVFASALGDRYTAANPSPHEWELEYTPKIKLQLKRDKSGGGCG